MNNDKPTYEELEKQIASYKKQIESMRFNSSLQDDEKGKRADELIIANEELDFQNVEKEKRAEELDVAIIELASQGEEKKKRASELIIANIELAYQKDEKAKRAAELIIANIELAYQKDEKAKRAAELVIANIELAYQKDEKGKRAAELIIANIKVALQSEEQEKLAAELIIANLAISLQAELIITKEKAEESDNLKSSFLRNMSHEIRTPMNAIIGFSDLLNDPELSQGKRNSYVTIIVNNSNQLLSIVNDILTISSLETKQEKINIQKTCINSIIAELFAVFEIPAKNKNISLYSKQHLTDKQSEILTDKTKLTQILSNLLINALKFTQHGFIEFGYNLRNNEVEFYVKDSGIGIKTDMQEKIFERFRQADKTIHITYGGSGLGLSISKAFVELLDGKIWLQSEPEKGSTFYFTIPYKPSLESDKIDKPVSLSKSNSIILIAEDEETSFLLLEELLSGKDFRIIHTRDGKETVEICKSNPDISLILMDIKMPIINGYDAAKLIKEFRKDLPIIAQSAYALENEIEKYKGVFDEYITKPIDANNLKKLINKFLKNN